MTDAVRYVRGDIVVNFLMNTRLKAICHCVNAQGKMGAGVAKDIRGNIPKVYSSYKKYIEDNILGDTASLLGHAQLVPYREENRYVVNLFGQNRYSRDSRMVDYGALANALYLANNKLVESGLLPNDSIGFPFGMACMNAGGDWAVVKELIEFSFKNFTVVYFKKY